MRKYLIITVISLMLCACSSESEDQRTNQIESTIYFPLTSGYVDYLVTQIDVYNDGNSKDSSSYFLREVISDSYFDSNDEEVVIIDQYEKSNIDASWQLAGRVTSQISNNRVIRTEGNLSQIKLALPPEENLIWDANALFDPQIMITIGSGEIAYYDNWESKYSDINKTVTIEEMQFDNVLAVSLADYQNRLEYRQGIEYYALTIGLIHKKVEVFDTQCFDSCSDIPWIEKASIGQIFIQTIIDYSNE